MKKNNVVDKRDGSKGYHTMKKVSVVIVIVGLILVISALTTVSLADVTVTEYHQGGSKTKTVYKSRGNADIRLDCRGSGGGCIQCGSCHTSEPQSETLKKLTQASWDKHISVYFPKQTHSLSEGQKMPWGDVGYYLKQRDRLVLYDRGNKRVWTAPPGSRILKSKSGEPYAVLFSGEPIR